MLAVELGLSAIELGVLAACLFAAYAAAQLPLGVALDAFGALGSALTTSPVQAMLPAFGWRGVFWALCLLALGAATWIFLSVPDKPRVKPNAGGPRRALWCDIALSGRILASRPFWRLGPAGPGPVCCSSTPSRWSRAAC